MIIIDNPLLIPTPLVLRHQNAPRWKVIQHLKKTHPFLLEELKPGHSSFPTLERDIMTILKRLELPATNFHLTLLTWLIENLTLFHYKKNLPAYGLAKCFAHTPPDAIPEFDDFEGCLFFSLQ
jgi:hypothetical protein